MRKGGNAPYIVSITSYEKGGKGLEDIFFLFCFGFLVFIFLFLLFFFFVFGKKRGDCLPVVCLDVFRRSFFWVCIFYLYPLSEIDFVAGENTRVANGMNEDDATGQRND